MKRLLTADEHTEAVTLMKAVRASQLDWPELAMLYAIPNGGHRSRRAGGRIAAEGIKAGMPDYCLPVPRGGKHGLYLELKTDKGRLAPEQRDCLKALAELGYATAVCRGWQAAHQTIMDYLASDGPNDEDA